MQEYKEIVAQADELFEKGAHEQAQTLYETLSASSQLPRETRLHVLTMLGRIHEALGDLKASANTYREGLALADRFSKRRDKARFLNRLACIACREGRYADSIVLLREELSTWSSQLDGYFNGLSANYCAQGYNHACLGDLVESEMYYTLAKNYALTAENYGAAALASARLGQLLESKNDLKGSRRAYKEAKDFLANVHDRSTLDVCPTALEVLAYAEDACMKPERQVDRKVDKEL